MRRRSALGVIGGAVAATAGLKGSSSVCAMIRDKCVSVREKYIRALVLARRMRDSESTWEIAVLSRYVTLLGNGRVVLHHDAPMSKVFTKDDWKGLEQRARSKRNVGDFRVLREISYWNDQPSDKILGMNDGDRHVSADIFAIATGMSISGDLCGVGARYGISYGYTYCRSPIPKSTEYASRFTGFKASSFEDGDLLNNARELARVFNDLAASFRLSEFRKRPVQEVFPHVIRTTNKPQWIMLAGNRFPLGDDLLNGIKNRSQLYHHLPDSRIDLGYRCPQTGNLVAGDANLSVRHGYMWHPEFEPVFLTGGYGISVEMSGHEFAIDYSTTIGVNKESLQNVIAFAVPKV